MEIDQSKYDRQRLAAERWRNSNGIGTLNLTPRFGKTFLAITFIINPHLKKHKDNCIIITVPSEAIANHWRNNLNLYGEGLENRIVVGTASYFATKDEYGCSLLIVDEPQKFMSDQRKLVIDGSLIKSKYRLALTGTPPTDYWFTELYPIVDTITEKEAIDNKWISKFIEYNYLLNLTDEDKIRYKEFTIPISETLELFKNKYKLFAIPDGYLFDNDFDLIQSCFSGRNAKTLSGDYTYIKGDDIRAILARFMGWDIKMDITTEYGKERNTYWNPNAIYDRAKKFLDVVRKRNDILNNNYIKFKAIKEIVELYPVTTICFNESIEFIDKTVDLLNSSLNGYKAVGYHSKIESKPLINPITGTYFLYGSGERKGQPKLFGQTALKKIVIEGVKNGTFKFLSTAKSLDEGLDIPCIEQVICTAGTTNPMTYQQRTARGKTVDIYNPNKVTKIFNLVFDDFMDNEKTIYSRDKQKLMLRQKNNSNNIQWIHSIDEINNNNYD